MSAQNQSPSLTLIGQVGKFAGRSFEGFGETIVVGRSKGCDITLDEGEISRQHARFSVVDGQWALEDLGSSNGTFINSVRITQSTYLNSGDTIGLGKNQFTFQPGGHVEAATVVDMSPIPQPRQYQQPPPQQPPPYQPPPPPQVQQVPVYVPVSPRRRRGGSCWITCLIIALVVIGITCIGLIGTYFLAKPTLDSWIQSIENCINDPQNCVLDFSGAPAGLLKEGEGVLEVSTGETGIVRTEDGASVMIPPDSVPLTEDGEPGKMNFSIDPAPEKNVVLPEGFQGYGNVYELGPEGFTFNSPVEISLPIPDGVDLEQVMGLTYFDPVSNSWKFVPGAVDPDNRTVTVMSTHFSFWSIFGRRSNDNWRNENGGYIEVSNSHSYETGTYPHENGRGKPYSISYGVCIESYSLDDPSVEYAWNQPYDWKMTVSDYRSPYSSGSGTRTAKWWLPNGTYQLSEVFHFSEVNRMYGYVPAYTNYYRSIGTYVISNGEVISFNYQTPDYTAADMINERPRCYGEKDTSVGTGDIQITLTWNASIDLDLWVTEPSGEKVYYSYYPSLSGGTLDRDNSCGEMFVGRPENIFWETGTAPNGEYLIQVNYYGACDSSGPISYTVRSVVNGVVNTYTGTIGENETVDVAIFTIP